MLPRILRIAVYCLAICLVAACDQGSTDRNVSADRAEQNRPAATRVRISPAGYDATEPAIAAFPDGRVAVAYVVKEGEAGNLYVRISDRESGAFSEPLRVNPAEGQVKTWYGDPPTIATGPDGKVYVGWTAKYPQGEKGTILYLSVSRDGAGTFGDPVRVNDDLEPASHGMHSMAVGPDGTVYFAWLDERYLKKGTSPASPATQGDQGSSISKDLPHPEEAEVEPNAELYFAASKGGASFEGKNRRLDTDVCPCCKTSTVVSEKGKLAIAYRRVFDGDFRHIAVTTLNDFGDAFGGPVQVSNDGWKINACPVSGPAMRFRGDELTLAWFTGGEVGPQGFYMSRSADGGRTFAERTLVEETFTGGQPAWAGGTLLWSSDGNIRVLDDTVREYPQVISAGSGKNVAAALGGQHVNFVFVVTEGDKRSVWLGRDPVK